MTTKYLGIESIVIHYNRVTIACNVMLDGENYSEPIYTNVFCDYYGLRRLLNKDDSELGNKIKNVVVDKFIQEKGENIQIDLPNYLDDRRLDWKYPLRVKLMKEIQEDIPFQCYRLDN